MYAVGRRGAALDASYSLAASRALHRRSMGLPVTLHVYDLGRGQLKAIGTHWAGAFHSAVEVNGSEWSFGATDDGSGVFSNAPRGCTMHT